MKKGWWQTLAVGALFGMGHSNAEAQEISKPDNIGLAPVENIVSGAYGMNETERNEATQYAVWSCMGMQQSHPVRIAQKYGMTSGEEAQFGDDMPHVYGAMLEYLALNGDKELGKALGLSEEQMTPKNMILALDYGTRLDNKVCEQIYEHARDDGRLKNFNNTSQGVTNLYSDKADMFVSIADGIEMSDSIIKKYGNNASALIVRALRRDKHLAQQFGFGQEKADASQLIYMLACRDRISDEVQNNMISDNERKEAEQVLATIFQRKQQGENTFFFNPQAHQGENKVEAVISAVQAHNEHESKFEKSVEVTHKSVNKKTIDELRGKTNSTRSTIKNNYNQNKDLNMATYKQLSSYDKQ